MQVSYLHDLHINKHPYLNFANNMDLREIINRKLGFTVMKTTQNDIDSKIKQDSIHCWNRFLASSERQCCFTSG